MKTTVCQGCTCLLYFHPDMSPPAFCHPCRVAKRVAYLKEK
jgi:hypothetical protein